MMRKPLMTVAPRGYGLNTVIGEGALDLLSLDLLVMDAGDGFTYISNGNETAFIPFTGDATAETDDGVYTLKRKDVFSEDASALCVPSGTVVRFKASERTELAVCKAKAEGGSVVFVPKEAVKHKTVGKDTWKRSVVDVIDQSVNAARLVVGETFNGPSGWSSFPPHKHDTALRGVEARMEEIYLFRIAPAGAFGTQTIYGGGAGEHSFMVRDYSAVSIPGGYHPVSAMPGCRLYYLWFLAGEGRSLMPNTDPAFKWMEV